MSKIFKKIIVIVLSAVVIAAALFFLAKHKVAKAPESAIQSTNSVATTGESMQAPIINETLTWPADQTINAKVLMYHHIGPLPENPDSIRVGLTVSAEKFENQMKYLSDNNYNVITLAEMYDLVAKGTLPEKSVVLTFDDGYNDNYAYAFPILKKYNMHGTFFIISDFLGHSDTMTKANIIDLYKNGNEIGSHTKTHPDLAEASATKAKVEIDESKVALENITGGKIVSLCYPSGKFNDSVEAEALSAGYEMAVTTQVGKPFSTNNPFEIPRYRMNPETNISTILK